MNNYCNVFMAYFINDKHCFTELTIKTFKVQDFFHIWRICISQLRMWVTLLLGINREVGSVFQGLISAFACNSYVKENLRW